MFFDLILLRRQHKGRMGFAWIAATRGINHVSKKDVLEVDISKLCEDIGQYVCSESDAPRSRFSLRLSSVLTNGTMKIYRQKAVYIIEDLFKMLTSVSKPHGIALFPTLERTDIIGTPPSPIPKKRIRKRRSPDKNTPQSQLEKLVADIMSKEIPQLEFHEDQVVLQARADEITLHETQPQREAPVEEFGTWAVLPTEEQLPRDITEIDKERAPPTLQTIEEVSGPLVPGITPIKLHRRVSSSSSEPEQGPVTFVVEAQMHVLTDVEMKTHPEIRPRIREKRKPAVPSEVIEVEGATPKVIEMVADVERIEEVADVERIEQVAAVERIEEVGQAMEVEEVAEMRPVLGELQVDMVEKKTKKVIVRKKKPDDHLAKLLISTKSTRVVRINRCETDEVDWIDIDPCPLPEFKLKTPNLTNLLNMYLIRDERDVERRRQTKSSTLEHSGSLRRESGRVTPPIGTPGEISIVPPIPEVRISAVPEEDVVPETPPIAESRLEPSRSLVTSTPVKRKTPEIEQGTFEEVMAVAAEERLETPRKRRMLVDVEPVLAVKDLAFITLPTEYRSRDLTVSGVGTFQQHTIDSVPLPILTEQDRQQDIVNKVFLSGSLTLEEVCQRPISRLNIARAFSDVLVLCKHNYVTLVSEDDSSELKFIERGPKMNR